MSTIPQVLRRQVLMVDDAFKKISLFERIISDEVITAPITVIAAHPDDETIGMASRISTFENLTLVHVTDGAPFNMVRARSLGFESVHTYSRVRFEELTSALMVLGATPKRRMCFGFSDGQTIFELESLINKIEATIVGSAAVFTHAYEGGHPDHDACALAVQAACSRIAATRGTAPFRLEFAGYHSRGGALAVNCFWPDAQHKERVVSLSWRERRLKTRAMREFRTQSFIMTTFPPRLESYREAPTYDFFAAPPSGEWFYDRYDWPLKGRDWLEQVALNRQLLCSSNILRRIEVGHAAQCRKHPEAL